MNKYTELSDFEINLAVAHIALGRGSYDWCPDKKEVYFAGIDGGEFLHHGYFDPCNNPSDAMPIIIENKISLRAPSITDRWKAEFVDEYGNYVGYIRALNKVPLRAAMEVYLLIKDAENEKV
ncbi:TPA: DUF2591 domain-containing protein [Proteus mirabilis]|nr:DUF2591 domain-containing protein [Proteus mirabilis]HAU5535679.1 DUF2591 domain-containing protein [Proteus mirabilis]HAU5539317.1 DUF2591 domain-containing protein [Proteus mirabilis]HAU5542753.1 DUF2591 domain-containing protein [Proteus mirabilis]HAU5573690.1 DUF2591 domain-containing protein [Proteus mirabilis]